eukprot:gnl/MRDRNA2_/MRDRNA2_74789_c0_seq1.p1 gnl/MRDRNA2_/MRDRNA2_74789_c0~~gnl/MRDRNA2_/MRDRNA2_74789_c0_seq1.p1  ORF type:complete len:163 (+),score=9.42 gnl/MRDRNA2_/MRDRNA2_74789_c0_seq1:77-565(+)
MPCSLYKRYPDAKFLHVTRDFEEHFPSIQYIHCRFHRVDHCLHPDLKAVQTINWGESLQVFCKNSKELCNEENGAIQFYKSPIWNTIKTMTRDRITEHEQQVRSCIPENSRLELNTATMAQDTEKIQKFLDCDGGPEEMPHDHKRYRTRSDGSVSSRYEQFR